MKLFLQRLSVLITTLVGISLISFFLIRIVPGDPVLLMYGERGASQEVYEEARKNLGLDKPIYIQYISYIKDVVKGNLGESTVSHRPVIEEFKERFPATVELSLFAMMLAILAGVPLGVFSALKRNTLYDQLIMGVSLVGYSMPIFWWGLILILVFSVHLGLTPVSGRIDLIFDIPTQTGFMLIDSLLSTEKGAFFSAIKHLILPSIALATIPMAVISRMTRSSLLEVLKEDYIRTAKAKGVTQILIIYKHALKNALIPILTVIGLMVGTLLTGAILTETIFSWPGIGKWLVNSVTSRDYPVIQSGILLIAVMVVVVNMLIDFLYVIVNPMMRK